MKKSLEINFSKISSDPFLISKSKSFEINECVKIHNSSCSNELLNNFNTVYNCTSIKDEYSVKYFRITVKKFLK